MDDLVAKRQKIIARAAGLVATMCAYTLFVYRRVGRTPPITYGPLAERDRIRMDNLRFIFHNDDRHCVEQLCMRRAPFFHLCTLLRTRHLLRDTIHSSVEEQVAIFFQEVLYAIGELRGEMIQPPSNDVHQADRRQLSSVML
uniref:DUF8040 domain-containing protein n=1 Tax=Arundo donax TaxID=35708 RepID=A0A0A9E3I6_ARUDO